MEYSDAFEREVNMTVGVAGLVMGGAAAVGNRCLGGLWEEGVLVSMVCVFFYIYFFSLYLFFRRLSLSLSLTHSLSPLGTFADQKSHIP